MPGEIRTKAGEIAPIRSEVAYMTAVIEASMRLQQLAEPVRASDTIGSMVRRVSRLVGLPETRVDGLWRRKARHVLAEEMDAIRAAARQRKQEEEARAELRLTEQYIARLEAVEAALRLRSGDPDFHRPQADAYLAGLGPAHRAMAGGDGE